jgi:hypothetical protein
LFGAEEVGIAEFDKYDEVNAPKAMIPFVVTEMVV